MHYQRYMLHPVLRTRKMQLIMDGYIQLFAAVQACLAILYWASKPQAYRLVDYYIPLYTSLGNEYS